MALPRLPAAGSDVNVNGMGQLVARLGALPGDVRDWNKETVERAALAGQRPMRQQAPVGEEGTGSDFPPDAKVSPSSRRGGRRSLRSRINYQREATWSPGGPGGGGTWSAQFGVLSLKGVAAGDDPAMFVAQGTGIRSISPFGSHTRIRPAGNLLTFMYGGRQVWAESVGGQAPQRKWIVAGQTAANREVRRRVAEFFKPIRSS